MSLDAKLAALMTELYREVFCNRM